MDIIANVQGDVVVVDGILDQPIPTCVAVTQICLSEKLAVRNVNQIMRNRDANSHALNLVAPLVLIRPPDTGSLFLAGSVNPGVTRGIFPESDTSKPSLLHRFT